MVSVYGIGLWYRSLVSVYGIGLWYGGLKLSGGAALGGVEGVCSGGVVDSY